MHVPVTKEDCRLQHKLYHRTIEKSLVVHSSLIVRDRFGFHVFSNHREVVGGHFVSSSSLLAPADKAIALLYSVYEI